MSCLLLKHLISVFIFRCYRLELELKLVSPLCTFRLPKGLLLSLKNILKSFSSSTQAGLRCVDSVQKLQMFKLLPLEFDGIIKVTVVTVRRSAAGPFTFITIQCKQIKSNCSDHQRVHFKAKFPHFFFLFYTLRTLSPLSDAIFNHWEHVGTDCLK